MVRGLKINLGQEKLVMSSYGDMAKDPVEMIIVWFACEFGGLFCTL